MSVGDLLKFIQTAIENGTISEQDGVFVRDMWNGLNEVRMISTNVHRLVLAEYFAMR